jgi:hypothetical protein
MDRDPIRSQMRRARKRRLLPPDAACVDCGEHNPEALIRINRSVLEGDHALGEAIAPEVVLPRCRNCHAVKSARERCAGVELERERLTDPLRRAIAWLTAVALCFEQLAKSALDLAEQLRRLLAFLDARLSDWTAQLADWNGATA